MFYKWEWLSDLQLIPAWECFFVGVIVGMLVTLFVITVTEDRR